MADMPIKSLATQLKQFGDHQTYKDIQPHFALLNGIRSKHIVLPPKVTERNHKIADGTLPWVERKP